MMEYLIIAASCAIGAFIGVLLGNAFLQRIERRRWK